MVVMNRDVFSRFWKGSCPLSAVIDPNLWLEQPNCNKVS